MRRAFFATMFFSLLFILLLSFSVAATTCNFDGIKQGDLCPRACDTTDYWGNPTTTYDHDCHAACTYGVDDCTQPCWNCLNPVERPDDRECTSKSIAASDTLFWAYHVNFGREDTDYNPAPAASGIFEDHYIGATQYFAKQTLFDESGLNGEPYRMWDYYDQGRYQFLIKDIKTGVPFGYGIHLLDADSGPQQPSHQFTACDNFIKATFTYDPEELEILTFNVYQGLCALKEPGAIECYLDRRAGLHRGQQGGIVARPLKAYAGTPYAFSVSAYFPVSGFTLTDNDMSKTFPPVTITGAPVERSVAQLSTSSYALMADVDDALWSAIEAKHAVVGSLPSVPSQADSFFYEADGVPEEYAPLSGEWHKNTRFRFTREGIIFGQVSNEPVNPSTAQPFIFHYTTNSGQSTIYVKGLKVEGTTLTGRMRLKGTNYDTNYFSFTEELVQNHFDTGASASLSCAADGKTVKATIEGTSYMVGVCENTCNAAGKCLLDDGTAERIFAGATGSTTTLGADECTPGEGKACSAGIRDLCLDHYWSGCPTGKCVEGTSRTCECSDPQGDGVQYCTNNDWGECGSCNPCTFSGDCTVGDYRCWGSCNTISATDQNLMKCVDNGCGKGYWGSVSGNDPECMANAVCAGLGSSGASFPYNVCGNRIKESGEICDGYDGTTCEDLGYTGGYLSCDTNCEWDTDDCTGSVVTTQTLQKKVERSPGVIDDDGGPATVECSLDRTCVMWSNCAYEGIFGASNNLFCSSDGVTSVCNAAMQGYQRGGKYCCSGSWGTSSCAMGDGSSSS